MEVEFVNTAWALVPALVAIVLALATKEVYVSLFVGILMGALLVAGFDPVATLDAIVNDGMIPAVADNAGIFIFLVLLGMMVALVNKAGGASAFGQWAATHVTSRVGTQIAAFALGVLIFVDDYFNCLTVGSVMRPLTDSKNVSRAKLAFIIDATAAPICMIAPVSSWAAAVSGVASDLNVNGIELFINAIPFNFYSLLMIVFVVGLIFLNFDYGPMAKAEIEAYKNGKLGSLGGDVAVKNTRASLWDMLVPIIVLIICCIGGMLYVGGFFGGETAGSIIDAFGNTDAFVALPWGSLIAITFAFLYFLARRLLTLREASDSFVSGFNAMVPAILVLTFAVSLKNMTGLLGADVFVAGLMEGAAPGLFNLLPAVIFLVAVFLGFSTGTSWGTFGILIPIVMPIFSNDPTLLIIGISACLAGAVAGDHCSPISDTTVMASAGANMEHVDHVSTQLPYVITMAAISFVMFVIAGFVQNAFICLPIGVVLTLGTLIVLKKTVGKSVKDLGPAKVIDPEAEVAQA
ncbi:Na+/H+ antiporter NhaC family protein [Adlercreutzia sp. ZJ305]|uniref:Na+/H+ antiporter NhaC family protein n=1 Tax=Adlercreutzia sp. ZJ305 TaxID=2709408 RepID=UPI00351B103B